VYKDVYNNESLRKEYNEVTKLYSGNLHGKDRLKDVDKNGFHERRGIY
jgi:hypothetical protein